MKRSYVYTLLIVLGLCTASFFLVFTAKAEEIDIEYGSQNMNTSVGLSEHCGGGVNSYICNIIPLNNPIITSIEFPIAGTTDYADENLYITIADEDTCGSPPEDFQRQLIINADNLSTTTYTYWHWTFETPLARTGTSTFYINYEGDEGGDCVSTLIYNAGDLRPKYQTYYGGETEDEDVVIIELPDYDDINVQVGTFSFEVQKENFCFYNEETECKIRYNYGYLDIGAMILLLPEYASSTSDFIDYVLDLPDQEQLTGHLHPTVRTSETDDTYWIFYSPDTGSSTLYEDINVHWIASTTAGSEQSNSIIEFFKGVLPLSIYYQLKTITNYYENNPVNNQINLTLDKFLPDETQYLVGTTTTILSINLLNEGLGNIWTNYFYPALQFLCWIITALITLKILSIFTKSSESL